MTYEPTDSGPTKKFSENYDVKYTQTFSDKIAGIDKTIAERIEKALLRLSENPYHNTKFAKGIWRGKREFRVGDLRVMLVICEECHKRGDEIYNQCGDCNPTPKLMKIADLIIGHKF